MFLQNTRFELIVLSQLF